MSGWYKRVVVRGGGRLGVGFFLLGGLAEFGLLGPKAATAGVSAAVPPRAPAKPAEQAASDASAPGLTLLDNKPKLLYFSRRQAMPRTVAKYYLEVASALGQTMALAPASQFARVQSPAAGGGGLWLASGDLTASHPQANLSTEQPRVKAGAQAGKMIAAVQRDLETLALESAVIVDCKPAADDRVAGCGLYYYDRSQERIIAASTRVFSVSIGAVEAWAKPMVSHFLKGLNTMEERKTKRLIDSLSVDKNQDDEDTRSESYVGLFGQIGFALARAGSSPVLGLTGAFGKPGSKMTLEGGFYRSAAANGESGPSYRHEGSLISLGLVASSDPLHGLIWDLGAAVGWQRHQQTALHAEEDQAWQEALHLSLAPALRIPLGLRSQLLARYDIAWRAPLAVRQSPASTTSLPALYQAVSLAYLVVL